MQIVIVTGLSGAGKSTALRALEDIEFTCVDNIPVPLVAQIVEHLAHEGDRDKLAIAIDSRQRRNLGAWHGALVEAARRRPPPRGDVPRRERRGAAAPVQRDAAPPPAVGRRSAPTACGAIAS